MNILHCSILGKQACSFRIKIRSCNYCWSSGCIVLYCLSLQKAGIEPGT